jgi:hypothetical protein
VIGLLAPSLVAAQEMPALAVDAGTEGNEPLEAGRIEDCVEVEVGERFDIDFVISDVTDLLAWEASLEYDPAVVIVVGHDVKLFQEANTGSSVIDVSAQVPDDSGFHTLSALETSDPPAVDSGTGTLARLTLEARAAGESPLELGSRDIDGDGTQDRGTLLKDIDAQDIADEDDDRFFDGEQTGALVVVGGECPEGAVVAEPGSGGSDDSSSWLYIAGAVVAAAAVLGGIAALLVMRGRSRRQEATPEV